MKRLDIVIIVLLIFISVFSLGIFRNISNEDYQEKYVEIYVNSKLFKRIYLEDDSMSQTFTIKTELGTNVVVIEDGRVAIVEADCPDKLCVKDGFISEPGEMLVCLPNKVVIEIKGKKKSEIDELSY